MLSFKRILFPTDLTKCAEGAFTHAAYIAQQTGAELHVLHVVEDQVSSPKNWMDDLQITADDIAADLRLEGSKCEQTLRLRGDFVPIVDVEIHAPKAGPGILAYANENDIDLVVMGTHGRRGFRRFMLGSVAQEVVRLAPCPVFTVGGQSACERGWAIRSIVAAVDTSTPAAEAAHHAAALADLYGAELTLLSIVDESTLAPALMPVQGLAGLGIDEILERRGHAIANRAKKLEAEFPGVGEIKSVARIGSPTNGIVSYLEESNADLLVIGSHGLSGMTRLLLGSVAESVIRSAPCPVFTVRKEGSDQIPAESLSERAAVTA